jgi:hypothetical protein
MTKNEAGQAHEVSDNTLQASGRSIRGVAAMGGLAASRVLTVKRTRKEALQLLGSGLAAMTLGGLSIEEAEALSSIKTGVFPYRFANPDVPNLVGGFRAFANGVNHKPYYLAAWTDYTRAHAGGLYDWSGPEILQAVKTLGVHLYLSLEVRPKSPSTPSATCGAERPRPRA